jgi:hypothetical protein
MPRRKTSAIATIKEYPEPLIKGILAISGGKTTQAMKYSVGAVQMTEVAQITMAMMERGLAHLRRNFHWGE